MRILFIINSLKNKSGSERVAVELANRLSIEKDFYITIINRESNQNTTAYPVFNTVKILDFPGNKAKFFLNLNQHIKKINYDYIVIHNMGKLSLLCSLLPKKSKLISLEHVAFISRPKSIQYFSQFMYKKFHQIITLTKSDYEQFSSFHNNVLTIPNFSPFLITHCKDKENNIVAIGRLTEQKNFLHLLQAWEKVYQKIPEWHLNIYGNGEQFLLLNNFIKTHQLQNISLSGETSDIKSVYEKSKLFVMSSKYEGLPMVLIEAQSFGLPIISYNCPFGPADIISDGESGFLVEDQNPEQLGAAILKLATSPNLLNDFSKHSLINAEKYQPSKIINTWINEVFSR